MLVDQNGQPLESTSQWVRIKNRAAATWKRLVVIAGGLGVLTLLLTNLGSIAKLLGIPWGEQPRVAQEQTVPARVGATNPKRVTVHAEASALTPDYMRLFGAEEVPLLMEVIKNGRELHLSPESSPDRQVYHDGVSLYPVNEKMYEFWRKFEYRKARPTAGGLWTRFALDSGESGLNMYYSALLPTKEDAMAFAVSYPDEDGDANLAHEMAAALQVSIKDSWWNDPPGTRDEDVAYLFIVLKNTSGETLRDVDITWIEYTNRLRTRNFFEDRGAALAKLSWPDPRTTALTDTAIKSMTGKRSTRSIASIGPDESFIWLLAVYRAKRNGLPEFYITNVYKPVETTYTIGGARVTAPVRAPYLERAERILVPWGWVGQ